MSAATRNSHLAGYILVCTSTVTFPYVYDVRHCISVGKPQDVWLSSVLFIYIHEFSQPLHWKLGQMVTLQLSSRGCRTTITTTTTTSTNSTTISPLSGAGLQHNHYNGQHECEEQSSFETRTAILKPSSHTSYL